MENARLFEMVDIEDIKRFSMHLDYEMSRKKPKERFILEEDMYYFINQGQCLLSATNHMNNNFTTIVDDKMVITTKVIGDSFNFTYQLTFIDTTILYSISKNDLENLISEQMNTGQFINCIIGGMENLLERLGVHIANLQIQPSGERLYSFLQGVAYLREDDIGDINVSRKDLGKMINVRRETCSRLLKEMEINGEIEEVNGSLIRVRKSNNMQCS